VVEGQENTGEGKGDALGKGGGDSNDFCSRHHTGENGGKKWRAKGGNLIKGGALC